MPESVFRWVVAVAVILACCATVWQAVILAAMFRAGQEARKAGQEAQARIGPLVDRFEAMITSSGKILEENRPRIAEITTETLAIAKTTRQHVDRLGDLLEDANTRAKVRLAQIDATVGHTVDQVGQATDTVRSAVMTPVREMNGIMAGVKAALNTYAQGRHNSPDHITQDEEMFI